MNEILKPSQYRGFVIQRKNVSSYEEQTVLVSASLNNIPYIVVQGINDVKNDMIPIGDIKFVQGVLGYKVQPNYYFYKPVFKMSEYDVLKRKVWFTNEFPLGKKVFIKPADEYKRFTGFVTNGGYKGKKRGPYVCSEVIKIKNEWRYYIGSEFDDSGRGFWYSGEDEGKFSPDYRELGIHFGTSHGCLDVGELCDGSLVLVEWQHPFSCGWYGKGTKDGEVYTKWLAFGYAEMVKDKQQVKE